MSNLIIDTHMHIGEILNFDMKETIVLATLSKYKIDFGIVSNIQAAEFGHDLEEIPRKFQIGQKQANLRTLTFVKNNINKVKGAFWIKPNLEGYAPWIEDFLVENKEYFCAIKIHPFHSKISVTDEKVRPYIELAEKLELPVVIHTAGDIYADAQNVYEIALQYPKVNFVMVHLGLGTDNEKAITLLEKLPNLYGDTTWVKVDNVLKAINKCGSEKLLFGTDSPIDGVDTYEKYEQLIETLKKKLTEEEYENVMFKNAIKLFGLNLNA